MTEHYPCILHKKAGKAKTIVKVDNQEEREAAYELGYKDSPADFEKPTDKPVVSEKNKNEILENEVKAKAEEIKEKKKKAKKAKKEEE